MADFRDAEYFFPAECVISCPVEGLKKGSNEDGTIGAVSRTQIHETR